MKNIFTITVGYLVMTGCASSSTQLLSSQKLPPKGENCTLEIFADASKIEQEFTEIALVNHITGADAFSDKGASEITKALKEEACKAGADGLIIKTITQGSWNNQGRGEGIAIKFTPPSSNPSSKPKTKKSHK